VQRTVGVAGAARFHYVTVCRRREQAEPT